MTKEQFEREKSYQLTMYIAKKLLKNGIITENEYRIVFTFRDGTEVKVGK